MDEEDGVYNRRKKKAKTRKAPISSSEQRPLLETDQTVDEEANYLTVTSVDLKNWFKGITGHKIA